MDFIMGIQNVGNKLVIMVVVYGLSKDAIFYSLAHPFTPSSVVEAFMDHIFELHGMPTSIVSY
jgi:hypothetical protein